MIIHCRWFPISGILRGLAANAGVRLWNGAGAVQSVPRNPARGGRGELQRWCRCRCRRRGGYATPLRTDALHGRIIIVAVDAIRLVVDGLAAAAAVAVGDGWDHPRGIRSI